MVFVWIYIILGCITLSGCASSAPPWFKGDLELNGYYEQGVGEGTKKAIADKNARVSLVGNMNGFDIKVITEDSIRVDESSGDEVIVRMLTEKGEQTISGKVPKGSFIAERWKDQDDRWWSYVLYEIPEKSRQLRLMRKRRIGDARTRVIVPGWAQFTKGDKTKGWRIVGIETSGLLGWWISNAIQSDFERRRDRSRPSAYDYYNKRVDIFAWVSVGFGSIVGLTYIYNVIDGLVNVPPTYRLSLSQTTWQFNANEGAIKLTLLSDL